MINLWVTNVHRRRREPDGNSSIQTDTYVCTAWSRSDAMAGAIDYAESLHPAAEGYCTAGVVEPYQVPDNLIVVAYEALRGTAAGEEAGTTAKDVNRD